MYDYETYLERQKLLDEMITFCKANSIIFFADLVDYASKNRYEDWFKILCSKGGTRYMVTYFKRIHHWTGVF